jgi:hypothetical protein
MASAALNPTPDRERLPDRREHTASRSPLATVSDTPPASATLPTVDSPRFS